MNDLEIKEPEYICEICKITFKGPTPLEIKTTDQNIHSMCEDCFYRSMFKKEGQRARCGLDVSE